MQNELSRVKTAFDRTSKYSLSLERQNITLIEENKELKIKIEDSTLMTKRHFEKIKELCVVLDKLTEENKKLKSDLENSSKQLKQLVETKSSNLDSKLEEYTNQIDTQLDKISKESTKDRDSELLTSIKSLTSSVKKINNSDFNEWIANYTSNLTDIIVRIDKKNATLAIRNRQYRSEVESLRNINCLFNSKSYLK